MHNHRTHRNHYRSLVLLGLNVCTVMPARALSPNVWQTINQKVQTPTAPTCAQIVYAAMQAGDAGALQETLARCSSRLEGGKKKVLADVFELAVTQKDVSRAAIVAQMQYRHSLPDPYNDYGLYLLLADAQEDTAFQQEQFNQAVKQRSLQQQRPVRAILSSVFEHAVVESNASVAYWIAAKMEEKPVTWRQRYALPLNVLGYLGAAIAGCYIGLNQKSLGKK